MTPELRQYLTELAAKKTATDRYGEDEEFNAMEHFGQYDDCYDGSLDDGEIGLARHLLAKFGGPNG